MICRSSPRVVAFVVATSVLAGAQTQLPPAPVLSSAEQAAVVRAGQAMQDLQATLVTRLSAAMAEGGAAAAVRVCRDEAQSLTGTIAKKHSVAIGRTSHRLRNPDNAPRAWATRVVAEHAGRKVAQVQPQTISLGGGKVGVLRPIGTIEMCLTCHGPRAAVEAAIGPVLATAYPNDQATGFAVGDLRGWIWVEAE